MDIIIELLKYIGLSSLIGVFISWFLSQKSEKNKIKYDERKNIKRTLFVLLEIRNDLLRNKKIERFLSVYVKQVNLRLSNAEKVNPTKLKKDLKTLITNINKDVRINNVHEQFNNCITELSIIDPILAYKINGKQNIQSFLYDFELEIKAFYNSEDITDIEEQLSHFKPKIINEIQNELEEIIRNVAELTKDKTIITNTNNLLKEVSEIEFEYDVGEYIDNILK